MIDEIYRYLHLIRRVEEEIAKIYPTDKIKSPVHLSIGQEAVAVGVCLALKPGDVLRAAPLVADVAQLAAVRTQTNTKTSFIDGHR